MGWWKKFKKAVKKAANAVIKAAKKVIKVVVKTVKIIIQAVKEYVNMTKELLCRFIGLLDVIGSLIRIRPGKKLRLRVVILRDENGVELVKEKEVEQSLNDARSVYDKETQTKILAAGGKLIVTLDKAAPTNVLDIESSTQLWKDDLGENGWFFSKNSAKNVSGVLFGYAAPVTVFIVRDVAKERGCSLGPLVDYVAVDVEGIRGNKKRILAHEVAHACGLKDYSHPRDNLMFADEPGEKLKLQQEVFFRNSRHITFL